MTLGANSDGSPPSMIRVAVVRYGAVALLFSVICGIAGGVALGTLEAPDWAYVAFGLVITFLAVFRVLEGVTSESRRR
jgi:hypothetical protein